MGKHYALIVDDNARYLAACGRLTRRRGFDPILIPSFEMAKVVVEAATDPPEAILIDVVLNSGHRGVVLRDAILRSYSGRASVTLMSAYATTEGINAIEKSSIEQIDQFLVESAVLRITKFHPILSRPLIKFAQQHSLTPQEARIASQLFAGTTRTHLAQALVASENTVKSQVRQVLKRTNTRSVDSLVASMLRFSIEATRETRMISAEN